MAEDRKNGPFFVLINAERHHVKRKPGDKTEIWVHFARSHGLSETEIERIRAEAKGQLH